MVRKPVIQVPGNIVTGVVDAIIEGAGSGKIGDGKFVAPVDELIRIRTAERGEGAP